MKGKKRGLSSILGTLIFLQILLISLLLIIHFISNETYVVQKSVERLQLLSENAPVTEVVETGIVYLYSTTPFIITHIIYPNGSVANTDILVNNLYPVSKILNGNPWAVIITSKGSWYNVTNLRNNNSKTTTTTRNITFPSYKDFGDPEALSALNVTLKPNWNVLDGLDSSPVGNSIVPVYIYYNGSTKPKLVYALTNATLVVYPNSTKGWINITFTVNPRLINWRVSSQGIYKSVSEKIGTAELGIYIPVNVTYTYSVISPNLADEVVSIFEYMYNFVSVNATYGPFYNLGNFWYFDTYVGPYVNYAYAFGNSQIDAPSLTNFEILTNAEQFANPPFNLTLPPYSWYNSTKLSAQQLSALEKIMPPPSYANVSWFSLYGSSNPLPSILDPIYKLAININKGIWALYIYDNITNSWVLIREYTFNYNNPNIYSQANSITNQHEYGYLYAVSGYWVIFKTPQPEIWYTGLYEPVYLYNIDNVQYISNVPIYIVIPSSTYVLQVNLS